MSWFITLSTPALAFAGALLGVLLNRRSARELELRSRREETHRSLRWAAELAAPDKRTRIALGTRQIQALGRSSLLDPEQQVFVDEALAVLARPQRGPRRSMDPDTKEDR